MIQIVFDCLGVIDNKTKGQVIGFKTWNIFSKDTYDLKH